MEKPHETPPLAAAHHPLVVARRARLRSAGGLRPAQSPRYVRAPREAERGARLARYRVGTPAARAELLVITCLRRESRQRQAANEPAGNPGRADRAAVKSRPVDNDAQARSYRWRSSVILGLVLLGGAGLVARAVELQLLDHGF